MRRGLGFRRAERGELEMHGRICPPLSGSLSRTCYPDGLPYSSLSMRWRYTITMCFRSNCQYTRMTANRGSCLCTAALSLQLSQTARPSDVHMHKVVYTKPHVPRHEQDRRPVALLSLYS